MFTVGNPKYKRKTDKQSYRNAMMHSDINELIVGNKIIIPKAGPVSFRQGYDFHNLGITKVWNITVKKTPTDKYFCSICCEVEDPKPLPHTGKDIAFDLGLKDFLVDSDGNVVHNPKYFKKSQDKLAKEQRKLSHCTNGSKNYKKQQLRVAKVHEKIKNQRNDFQHKLSRKLIAENQCIYSEDLNVNYPPPKGGELLVLPSSPSLAYVQSDCTSVAGSAPARPVPGTQLDYGF